MTSVHRLRSLFTIGISVSLVAMGCGGPSPVRGPTPVEIDTGRIAVMVQEMSRLDHASRIVFDWSSAEQGSRFRGRGVTRIEPPYRARLDLFLPNGETVVKAALVDGDLRLPAGLTSDLLPPPRLLWATLGMVRPGAGGALLGGETTEDGSVTIRYGYEGDEQLRYLIRDGLVQGAELLRNGEVTESVNLERARGDRFPTEAVYRHLRDYRELRITRSSVERVETFPPDIWDPRG